MVVPCIGQATTPLPPPPPPTHAHTHTHTHTHYSALLESLCYSLYDMLRPVIIHINHMETLAEVCSILKVCVRRGVHTLTTSHSHTITIVQPTPLSPYILTTSQLYSLTCLPHASALSLLTPSPLQHLHPTFPFTVSQFNIHIRVLALATPSREYLHMWIIRDGRKNFEMVKKSKKKS